MSDTVLAGERAVGAAPERPWFDHVLSTYGVVAFWIGFGLLHIALRFLMSGALSLDDARANETTQILALGYQVRQPPLYSWLLWAVQEIVGTGLASIMILRYALIALIGITTYSATLAACRDRRWAALASFSALFTYAVGWSFHELATETLLLSIACLVTVHAAIRFLEQPTVLSSALLGAAIGIGLLSKFSYPLFLLALGLAGASMADVRRRLADPRLLIALAVALLLISPYVWWLVGVRGDVAGMASDHLIHSQQSHLTRSLLGLVRLAWSLPAFLLPWLAIVAALSWPLLGARPASEPPTPVPERLVLRTMLFAALLMAIGIAAIGATNIAERYMHVALMVAPVYLFARLARLAPATMFERRFVIATIVAVVGMIPVRVLSFENEIFGRPTRAHALPYAGLAKALAERNLTDGTFVTSSVRVAGNLRQYLPNVRYVSAGTFLVLRPPRRPSDDRSCALVWSDLERSEVRALAAAELASGERIAVTEPSVLGQIRRGVWFVTRLDPASQLCR